MTIAEAFRVFGEALDVEFAGEQSVAEVLSTIAVKFGGTRQQTIADAANEIAKVADHITAIGDATLVTKSITDNGTYNATSDEADGYSTVTVEVPEAPSGYVEFDATSLGTTSYTGNTQFVSGAKKVVIPEGFTKIYNSSTGANTTEVSIPSTVTEIEASAFADSASVMTTITINKAEDSITGAPWGATNATVVWTGEAE